MNYLQLFTASCLWLISMASYGYSYGQTINVNPFTELDLPVTVSDPRIGSKPIHEDWYQVGCLYYEKDCRGSKKSISDTFNEAKRLEVSFHYRNKKGYLNRVVIPAHMNANGDVSMVIPPLINPPLNFNRYILKLMVYDSEYPSLSHSEWQWGNYGRLKIQYGLPKIQTPGRWTNILSGVVEKLGIQGVNLPIDSFKKMKKQDKILADLGAKAILEVWLGAKLGLNTYAYEYGTVTPKSASPLAFARPAFSDDDIIKGFSDELLNITSNLADRSREIGDRLMRSGAIIGAATTVLGLAVSSPALLAVGTTAAVASAVGLGFGTVNGMVLDMAPGIAGLEARVKEALTPSFNYFFNTVAASALSELYIGDKLKNILSRNKIPQEFSDATDIGFKISDRIAANINPLDEGLAGKVNDIVGSMPNYKKPGSGGGGGGGGDDGGGGGGDDESCRKVYPNRPECCIRPRPPELICTVQ